MTTWLKKDTKLIHNRILIVLIYIFFFKLTTKKYGTLKIVSRFASEHTKHSSSGAPIFSMVKLLSDNGPFVFDVVVDGAVSVAVVIVDAFDVVAIDDDTFNSNATFPGKSMSSVLRSL